MFLAIKRPQAWMLGPSISLDNRRFRLTLLSSAAGAEAVENALTRMEYGSTA